MQRGARIGARWVPLCLTQAFFCQELERTFLVCRGVGLTADSPARERDLGCFAFQRNPPGPNPFPGCWLRAGAGRSRRVPGRRGTMLFACLLPPCHPAPGAHVPNEVSQQWPPSPADASRCQVLHGSSLLGTAAASEGHRAGGRRGVNWSKLIHGAPGVFSEWIGSEAMNLH